MIKSMSPGGKASVTFILAGAVGADHAAVCGEWNDWSADRDVMERTEESFTRTVELESGRTYRFRYLLNGCRWENDWAADAYVPNDHGSEDSLVDLTAVGNEVPAAAAQASAPATKTTAKKAARAKTPPPTTRSKKAQSERPAEESPPAKKPAPRRTTKGG
jgi:hypothetical protein